MESTITIRTRSLGYGWTNEPEQTRSGLAIKQPQRPDVVGTLRDCETEAEHAGRINNSNYWRSEFFVGARRITHVLAYGEWFRIHDLPGTNLLSMLREEKSLTVRTEE